jgi:hypothetical protein
MIETFVRKLIETRLSSKWDAPSRFWRFLQDSPRQFWRREPEHVTNQKYKREGAIHYKGCQIYANIELKSLDRPSRRAMPERLMIAAVAV